jgi:hypothetical protein
MSLRRSRTPKARTGLIPPEAFDGLPAIGRAAFLDHRPPADVSHFYLPVLHAMGYPSPGTPEWRAFVDSFLNELVVGAESTGEWGIVGAFYVARDLLGSDLSSQRYVDLVDRALSVLHEAGVPSAALPPFVLERWRALYGDSGNVW